MTREEADIRATRPSCSEYSLVNHNNECIRVLCPQGFAERHLEGGSRRSLHLFRFVVLCGAVGGQDDLERTQAIEPARARGVVFGHAA